MECLKCGRETSGKDTFCKECMSQMEKYPIQPGVPVVIPKREEVRRKASPKKAVKPEEQIEKLNQTVRRLRRWVSTLLLLFLLTAGALGYVIWSHSQDPEMGSNYSTVTTPDEGGTN